MLRAMATMSCPNCGATLNPASAGEPCPKCGALHVQASGAGVSTGTATPEVLVREALDELAAMPAEVVRQVIELAGSVHGTSSATGSLTVAAKGAADPIYLPPAVQGVLRNPTARAFFLALVVKLAADGIAGGVKVAVQDVWQRFGPHATERLPESSAPTRGLDQWAPASPAPLPGPPEGENEGDHDVRPDTFRGQQKT